MRVNIILTLSVPQCPHDACGLPLHPHAHTQTNRQSKAVTTRSFDLMKLEGLVCAAHLLTPFPPAGGTDPDRTLPAFLPSFLPSFLPACQLTLLATLSVYRPTERARSKETPHRVLARPTLSLHFCCLVPFERPFIDACVASRLHCPKHRPRPLH